MKYIKTYEARSVFSDSSLNTLTPEEKEWVKNYKFKIGDYVRFSPLNWNKNVHIIKGISVTLNWKTSQIYSLYDLAENFVGWFSEKNLQKVPELEVTALKYNL